MRLFSLSTLVTPALIPRLVSLESLQGKALLRILASIAFQPSRVGNIFLCTHASRPENPSKEAILPTPVPHRQCSQSKPSISLQLPDRIYKVQSPHGYGQAY